MYTQSGRSMVEMLGVLAIIGVLSVGAIAGYSKAMMKYKLNKQSQQISTILNNALIYAGEFSNADKNSVYIIPMLIKLKVIPEEMISGAANYPTLHDSLNNRVSITWGNETNYSLYAMNVEMSESDYGIESCRNIVNTVKENHADLFQIVMRRDKPDSGGIDDMTGRTYGDRYCNGDSRPCLRNMSLSDIQDFCNECVQDENQICTIQIMYGYVEK